MVAFFVIFVARNSLQKSILISYMASDANITIIVLFPGIFVLFGIFWLKLNMFVTLRYLLGFGIVTFLAGNKMLSQIAHRHKSLR